MASGGAREFDNCIKKIIIMLLADLFTSPLPSRPADHKAVHFPGGPSEQLPADGRHGLW